MSIRLHEGIFINGQGIFNPGSLWEHHYPADNMDSKPTFTDWIGHWIVCPLK